jgi:hypothetical protein
MSTHPADISDIGILVLDEFIGLQDSEFIRVACQHLDFPNYVYAKWRDLSLQERMEGVDPKWLDIEWRDRPEIPLLYGDYRLILNREYHLHLYTLPEALRGSFLLADILFPVSIRGCVLIVNYNYAVSQPLASNILFGLEWIKKSRMPVVVAITYQKIPDISFNDAGITITGHDISIMPMDQIRDQFGIDLPIPVFLCQNGIAHEVVKGILLGLVEQIEARDSGAE